MTPVERVIRNLLTDYRYGNKTTDDVVEMLVDMIDHAKRDKASQEAIEFLKGEKYIGEDKYASGYDMVFNEAIDTVVADLNTENIRGLDDKLDEKVIEQSVNQGGLSHNKDKKFSPELLQTHYPFMVEMGELLTRKKLGMATIIKAQSIITRCHLHGMEVGYDAALRFTKQIKNGD
jgi:polyhydroxyalkanoate synthesis regulator phasin